MMPFFMPFAWGWGVIGFLIAIMIIGCIIRAIVFAAHGGSWRRYHYYRHHRRWEDWTGDDSAAEARRILDERYAKGEINEDEYKKMKENLK